MNLSIKDILYRIRVFFIPYLILLCVCLIIKLLYSREDIYFAVNGLHSASADFIAPYVTDFGEGLTIVILSLIIGLYNYQKAFLLFTSWGVTAILAQIIKHFINAPRPKLYFAGQLKRIHFVKGVEIFSYNSFPSGHTVTAFSAAVVLTYLVKNKSWGLVFLIAAILVGYSRMYLSEHFFEDVVGGSVLGVIVTVFWIYFLESKQFLQGDKWKKGLLNR
ncbi:MAG: phosphatase PAP2 family protein [Mucilaginibacter sp.]